LAQCKGDFKFQAFLAWSPTDCQGHTLPLSLPARPSLPFEVHILIMCQVWPGLQNGVLAFPFPNPDLLLRFLVGRVESKGGPSLLSQGAACIGKALEVLFDCFEQLPWRTSFVRPRLAPLSNPWLSKLDGSGILLLQGCQILNLISQARESPQKSSAGAGCA
jgi:hypothetical protein